MHSASGRPRVSPAWTRRSYSRSRPLVRVSGIRAAEIERLDWKDVFWDRGYIEIKAAKAKTKARRLVPLLPNLGAWLELMRKAEGPVCALPNLHFRLNYLGDKAGIGWRQNALRHSYASYRLADTPDAARVALEMGNSPEKLFRHYRELATPEAAKEWFAIMPPSPSQLVLQGASDVLRQPGSKGR